MELSMIVFEKIKYKNFLSTGNVFTEMNLNENKTTLVSGENGAGKSTLLDALTFVLFGKSFRGINVPQLVNSINAKDCFVEVEFSTGKDRYKIRRGIKPRLFEIEKNGQLIKQQAKSKDYQRVLEDQILKLSYKSFCQVVVLGSSNYIPFMKLSAADRRSVVESILDIDVFSSMNSILKTKISENREKIRQIEYNIELTKEKLETNKVFIESLKKKSEETKNRHLEEITKSKEEIESANSIICKVESEIKKISDDMPNLDTLEEKIRKMRSLREQLSSKAKSIQDDIDFYETHENCPTCSQEIDCSHKETIVSKKTKDKTEINHGIDDLVNNLSGLEKELTDAAKSGREIVRLQETIREKNNDIKIGNSYISKLNEEIESLSDRSDDIVNAKEKLKELAKTGQLYVTEKDDMKENDYYYGIASTLLKDGGIKRRIIKHYIPAINKIINGYLQQQNFFVKFELDEEFNETLKSRHRDEFTYHNFSEGERRKIDLALLFAWRATAQMKNSVNTNLLILDEVLDGSLDNAATESFLEIIANLNKNCNVFVISHKPKEILQDKFEKNIIFKKKNGFSIKY